MPQKKIKVGALTVNCSTAPTLNVEPIVSITVINVVAIRCSVVFAK